MLNNIIHLGINLTFGIKFIILSIISFILGSSIVEGSVLFLQSTILPDTESNNWLAPFLGGVGGLIVVIIGQFFSYYFNTRAEKNKDERKKESDKNSQYLTFTDKIAELQQDRDDKFLEDLKKFHEDKIQFKDVLIRDLKISEYSARQREHLAVNEVNRLWGHIYLCHTKMKLSGIEVPEFSFRNNDEIMNQLEDRIVKFVQELDRE